MIWPISALIRPSSAFLMLNDIISLHYLGTDYESGLPYWLIPNSFGTQWGDNGYVKFLRGSNNCGIEGEVSFGTVQVPYSDAIKAKQGNAQADDLKTKGAKCDS